MNYLNILFLAFIITGLSFGLVNTVRLYLKQHLADIPNERSSHTIPTPRGGGIGFILAFIVGLIFYNLTEQTQIPGILPITAWLSFLPLILVGIIDDVKGISAPIRYSIQIVVACFLVWSIGVYPWPLLQGLGTPGAILSFVLTAISITAFINFYNFMDGLDGLVAGCALVQILFLSTYLQDPVIGLLGASLIGFLYWNWSPAKIFMGDIGSTFLGAVISAVLLAITQEIELGSSQGLASLSITFPVLLDSSYTLIRRLNKKENIFQAHKSHIYQRLQQTGLSHSKVAGLYVILTIAMVTSISCLGTMGAILNFLLISLSILKAELFILSNSDSTKSGLLAYTRPSSASPENHALDR